MRSFDACVLVVSNRAQANSIRELVTLRTAAGLYPREIDFVVVSDPERARIGSGGATILAVDALRSRIDAGESLLLIHAGGESRRMPTFASEGKLFAPLPAASSSTIPPVILDLQLSLFLKYPWQAGEVIVSSGDVVIDFDTDLVPQSRGEIYGFAKSESFALGAEHGVFKFDRNRTNVVDFFQKESAAFLEANAALEGARACALDLGIIGFSPSGVARLRRLGEARTHSAGTLVEALRGGELYLDLYLEILTACLSGLSFERYREKLSRLTTLGERDLRLVFGALEDANLHASLVKRATFLHFGSLPEYPQSCESVASGELDPFYLGPDADLRPAAEAGVLQFNSHNCVVQPNPPRKLVCVEGCRDCSISQAKGDNLFSGLEKRTIDFSVPEGICLDERSTDQGVFLLAYHRGDTWRVAPTVEKLRFCGTPMGAWLTERGIEVEEVFPSAPYDLYEARLWPVDPSISFVEGYWRTDIDLEGWRSAFRVAKRSTLREIASLDTAHRRELRRREIRSELLKEEVASSHAWLSMPEWDFRRLFTLDDLDLLEGIYRSTDDDLVRLYRRRLLDSLRSPSRRVKGAEGEAAAVPHVEYLDRPAGVRRLRRGVKVDQIVWARAPVRLDLAGGWTDTPPYTLREGGEVVNVAVDLNGQPPIQVFCRATEELGIRIQSIDVGAHETIHDFGAVENYSDPGSPFALPKAALYLLGLTREQTGQETLEASLRDVGCGLEITLLSAVPKGSGLGTSSILGAVILAALERFFGLAVDQGELIRQVLQIEQMLTTGGGWQDQIGGVAGGVKYIQTEAGFRPEPIVYQLDPYLFSSPETSRLFTLYYTGVTRLAKNILREVVDRVNGFEPAYLFTLRRLKGLARSARDAMSLRDLSGLGEVLRGSWTANKLIHPSTTNDEVESLLSHVAGLYDGMKLLGAGGGGYVLFLSRDETSAEQLRDRLSRVEHERARVVGMALNEKGLEVTVS